MAVRCISLLFVVFLGTFAKDVLPLSPSPKKFEFQAGLVVMQLKSGVQSVDVDISVDMDLKKEKVLFRNPLPEGYPIEQYIDIERQVAYQIFPDHKCVQIPMPIPSNYSLSDCQPLGTVSVTGKTAQQYHCEVPAPGNYYFSFDLFMGPKNTIIKEAIQITDFNSFSLSEVMDFMSYKVVKSFPKGTFDPPSICKSTHVSHQRDINELQGFIPKAFQHYLPESPVN